MKKVVFLFFSLLVGIILFSWVINLVGWQEVKEALLIFSGWKGLVIFFLGLLMIVLGSWKWKEILGEEKKNFPFFNLFLGYLAGFAIMFLAPILFLAGEFVRIYILRKKEKVSWSKAVSSVVIDRVLEWTVNLVVVFIGTLLFLNQIGLPPRHLLIAFGGAFLLFFTGIFIFYLKTFRKESITKTFIHLFNDQLGTKPLEAERMVFEFFRKNKKKMSKAFFISFMRAGVMYIRGWFLIIFLGKNISASSALSVLGFTYLAAMIPIPASLGSHETIQAFAFRSLGLGFSTATAFTMIIRGTELLLALGGLLALFHFGFKSFQKFIEPH